MSSRVSPGASVEVGLEGAADVVALGEEIASSRPRATASGAA